jgi:glycosyltransferase 2 family protein
LTFLYDNLMHLSLIKYGRTLLFLAVGIFFLVLAFRGIHLDDLVSGFLSARFELVLLSLIPAFFAYISRAWRWRLLIEPLGYKPPVKNAFYALLTGHLANFIFPRLGEFTRCGSLNRTDKIPFDSLLGTVIVERISDLIAILLLVIAVFFIKIDVFGQFLLNNLIRPLYQNIFGWLDFHWLPWLLIILSIILLLLFFRIIKTWLGKYKIFRQVGKITARVMDGMKSVLRMKKKVQFVLHTIFIWVMYYIMTIAVSRALPSTAALDYSDILFIMVIGSLGMIAPVQGGIGAYHWIVSMALTLFGIPREDGLVFATLSHESQALFTILLGFLSLYMVYSIQRKTGTRVSSLILNPENLNNNGQD